MSSLILECKESGDFIPHPEGIHPAVCVDVIDLGLVESEFQGQRSVKPKIKVVFESEQKTPDGKNCSVSRNFTASLNPKAKLAEFLGKWRGRPVVPGDTVDLNRLIGASCTLVISHQKNLAGKTYASIDAVSKPTRKVTPSGTYDPVATRQRYAEWSQRAALGNGGTSNIQRPAPNVKGGNVAGGAPATTGGAPVLPKSSAAPEYDPEVGF
jgi:hypothetical protein